jgi:hypothetical protein
MLSIHETPDMARRRRGHRGHTRPRGRSHSTQWISNRALGVVGLLTVVCGVIAWNVTPVGYSLRKKTIGWSHSVSATDSPHRVLRPPSDELQATPDMSVAISSAVDEVVDKTVLVEEGSSPKHASAVVSPVSPVSPTFRVQVEVQLVDEGGGMFSLKVLQGGESPAPPSSECPAVRDDDLRESLGRHVFELRAYLTDRESGGPLGTSSPSGGAVFGGVPPGGAPAPASGLFWLGGACTTGGGRLVMPSAVAEGLKKSLLSHVHAAGGAPSSDGGRNATSFAAAALLKNDRWKAFLFGFRLLSYPAHVLRFEEAASSSALLECVQQQVLWGCGALTLLQRARDAATGGVTSSSSSIHLPLPLPLLHPLLPTLGLSAWRQRGGMLFEQLSHW